MRLILCAALCVVNAAASETEDRLLALKKELPFISAWEFLHNYTPRDYGKTRKITAAWTTLQGLRSAALKSAELVRLAEHEDAAVRCLAILALAAQEAPDFVPVCMKLVNDSAPTIPAVSAGDLYGPEVLIGPQTVGEVAQKCLQMVGCDFRYPSEPQKAFQPDEETWWKLRQANVDWLGWHAFLYKRATTGVSPLQEEAKPAVKVFRGKVDRLPPTTRAWLLLYLADDVFMSNGLWQDWYATEEEMISAVRGLGAPALIDFLQTGRRSGLKEPALDDPKRGTRFIVTYAKHFFSPENVGDLIALKQYTAAMDAEPSRVRQVKDEALKSFSEEYQLWDAAAVMAALADHGDATDRAEVVKWLYSQNAEPRGSSVQGVFLSRLRQRHPREGKEFIRLLVSDPAFDRMRPSDVMSTAWLLEVFAKDFSCNRTLRSDKAEQVRGLLRSYFKTTFTPVQELKLPGKYLEKTEWSVELDGLGRSMVLNPGGSLLAVGMSVDDGGVRVLDAADGKEKHRIAQSGRDLEVFFNHDGSRLFFHAPNDTDKIRAWDVAGGTESWQPVESQSEFQLAADKPFGVFDGDSNEPRFFGVDTTSFKTLWSQDYPRNRRRNLRLSPDGRWIALVDEAFKVIQLLDFSKKAELVTEFAGHATFPEKFVFSPDSTRLVSCGEDNRVILWDVNRRKMQSMFHGDGVRYGRVGFTADSQAFFAAAGPHGLGVYAMDGAPLFGIKCSGNWMANVVPSRDGRFLYIMVQHASRSSMVQGVSDQSRIECWRLK